MSVSAVDYAAAIISARDLAQKLAPSPKDLSFEWCEATTPPTTPGRPANLQIVHGRFAKVPPVSGMADPQQRVRILHALANHELQAIELFAWASIAFADQPIPFRRGLIAILHDEQRHMAAYIARIEQLGHQFGDFAVTGHFWNRLSDYRTPLHFVATMGLTFENANLDFALEYEAASRKAGDHATADVLAMVHREEISHVHFGWVWLHKLAGIDETATTSANAWQTFASLLEFPLGPHRARGKSYSRQSRLRAGLSPDFVDRLEQTVAGTPSGLLR